MPQIPRLTHIPVRGSRAAGSNAATTDVDPEGLEDGDEPETDAFAAQQRPRREGEHDNRHEGRRDRHVEQAEDLLGEERAGAAPREQRERERHDGGECIETGDQSSRTVRSWRPAIRVLMGPRIPPQRWAMAGRLRKAPTADIQPGHRLRRR